MGDFEDKLSAVLSNPDMMKQVMSIAQSFKDESAGSDSGDTPDDDTVNSGSTAAFPDLGSIGDIGNIMDSLKNIDPKIIRNVTRLIGEYNAPNENRTALLSALKPYIKEERRDKIDKAIQIAKLSRVAKSALSSFSGED